MSTLLKNRPAARGVYRPYPQGKRAFRRFQRMPLLLWRLGLARLVGRRLMVLTTVGRRSGLTRHAMVTYYRVGSKKYVYSGYGPRSDWFHNLEAQPRVTIQTIDGTESALARRVTEPCELTQVLRIIQSAYPASAAMLKENWGDRPLTDEAIAADAYRFYLVAFDATDKPTPLPLDEDLRWALPVVMVVGVSLLATLIVNMVDVVVCWLRRRLSGAPTGSPKP